MCIANSETDTSSFVVSYIPNIFKFVMMTSSKSVRPTVSYLNRCILLMADIAKTYPSAVVQLKKEPFVAECINTLKNFNRNNKYDDAIKYA